MHYLKTGDLAFFDSAICGPIPCRIISIKREQYSIRVRAQVTANRRGYTIGETIEYNSLHMVPRSAWKRRKYGRHIEAFAAIPDGESCP